MGIKSETSKQRHKETEIKTTNRQETREKTGTIYRGKNTGVRHDAIRETGVAMGR